MSREVRRVPLDFEWPLHQIWSGYITPDGLTDEERDEWEGTEPPEGEGWQLWETTSEGSPISPVFKEGEELAQWMSTNPCGFAHSSIPLDIARRWIERGGWAPSMVFSPQTGLVDGITYMARRPS